MSETNLRAALDGRLNSMPNKPRIVWENTRDKQTGGVYISQAYVTAEDIAVGIEQGGTDVLAGLMQLTVNAPKGGGKLAALTEVERIKARFPRGLRITQNGTAVVIHKVFSSPSLSDENYYRIPVSIRYRGI